MRNSAFIGQRIFLGLLLGLSGSASFGELLVPPEWAYPVNPPDFKSPPDNGAIRHVPDSSAGFSLTELRNQYFAPDWHPDDHPQMPKVVAEGRKPDVRACGFCHRADGSGGPENASLSGLPYAYLMQQMIDYRSGNRSMAEQRRSHQHLMNNSIKALTDAEMEAAATYFSAVQPRQNVKVVESGQVPQTFIANWFWAAKAGNATEPIGYRIVEIPDDLDRFESRDGRATFTAYVPEGSLRAGAELASGKVNEKVAPCETCHGAGLRGNQSIPPIAGRSPTYLFRQLYEFKTSIRHGKESAPMIEMTKNLSLMDLLNLSAYVASIPRQ